MSERRTKGPDPAAAREEPVPGQSVGDVLDRVRASKAELAELRKRRESAVGRADAALKRLRGEKSEATQERPSDESLQERIQRVSKLLDEERARNKR